MQICFCLKKNLVLHLRKIHIRFLLRKFRSASNKDAYLFLFEEKFRFTSKKDANLLLS